MNQLLSDTQKLQIPFFEHFSSETKKYLVRDRVYDALKMLEKAARQQGGNDRDSKQAIALYGNCLSTGDASASADSSERSQMLASPQRTPRLTPRMNPRLTPRMTPRLTPRMIDNKAPPKVPIEH